MRLDEVTNMCCGDTFRGCGANNTTEIAPDVQRQSKGNNKMIDKPVTRLLGNNEG